MTHPRKAPPNESTKSVGLRSKGLGLDLCAPGPFFPEREILCYLCSRYVSVVWGDCGR